MLICAAYNYSVNCSKEDRFSVLISSLEVNVPRMYILYVTDQIKPLHINEFSSTRSCLEVP